MKKILILLAVVGLTFTSCYQDEYEAPSGGVIAKKAYFTAAEEIVSVSATAYDVTVNFTEAFTNDVLLSYTVDGTSMQMTVTAGSTTAVLTSVDISSGDTRHDITLNAIASNSESVAIDTDRKDFTVLVPYDGAKFTLTWADSSRDLDPRIKTGANNSGTTIDASYGSTTTEVVEFPSSTADGMYYYYINEYAFTADVDVTITVEDNTGTHVFTTTVHNDSDVMTFTKATDGGTGVITYTYTVL